MSSETQPHTLKEWLSVLSPRLRKLVDEAERQAWPFIPEEWQFDSNSKNESVNVKDLIMSCNMIRPDMSEGDVLKQCLEQACFQQEYRTAAAVAFVLDRFMYWYGTSKYIIDKVEYIRKVAPTTPIAPQVIIRKARVLKDGGALQNAEKTVDFIIKDKRHREQWHYTDESQYERTRITCVLLKGVIRHNLGLWLESADMVFETIIGYNNLSIPDLKGVASSICYLSDILRNMSASDYQMLQTKYVVHNSQQPLMEAYAANRQAAWLTRFEPFFVAGHQRRAGEVLLMYAVTLPPEERQHLVEQALTDLKRGLIAHNSITSLASKQQLYEFIFTLYQIVVTCYLDGTKKALEKASEVETYCMVIYKHYSAAKDSSVPLTPDDFISAVNGAMTCLDLPRFRGEGEEKINPLKDIPAYGYIYPTFREGMHNIQLTSTTSGPLNPSAPSTKSKGKEQSNLIIEDDVTIADPSATTLLQSEETEQSEVAHTAASIRILSASVTGHKCEDHSSLDSLSQKEESSERVDQDRGAIGNTFPVGTAMGDSFGDECDGNAELRLRSSGESGYVSAASQSTSAETSKSTSSERNGKRSKNHISPKENKFSNGFDKDAETTQSIQEELDLESDDATSHIPTTFLTSHLSHPITSFSDPSLTAALGSDQKLKDQMATSSGNLGNVGYNRSDHLLIKMTKVSLSTLSVYRARVFKYDPKQRIWTCLSTLVYKDEELDIDKKGAMRDVFELQYLHQDEPRGRYVGKKYRKTKYNNLENYYQDVLCQMTSRHYVALFNQALRDNPQGWQIQFVPAAHIQLLSDDHKDIVDVFNVEPYVAGSDFVKVTNNFTYVNPRLDVKLLEVSLAFMHFTYNQSRSQLLVTDLQGWLPQDQEGTIIFTDPVIHSVSLMCFETGNLGQRGFDAFWQQQHPKCNRICQALHLHRPI